MMENVMEKKNPAPKPKNTTPSVKHGCGSAMAQAPMSANGTGTLAFIDEFAAEGSSSSRTDAKVPRSSLCACAQPNATKNLLDNISSFSRT